MYDAKNPMPWIRRNLRGNRVYVRCDAAGAPDVGSDGRVDIVYKLGPTSPIYRAAARNLQPTGDPDDDLPRESRGGEPGARAEDAPRKNGEKPAARARPRATAAPPPTPPRDAIVIYTDGACTGNPGPAGLGVVVMDGDERRELSEYLGTGTNNIAELTAIERALEIIPPAQRGRPIYLHTDSSYSIGILTKGWKAKANQALVARIRELLAEFPRLRLVKVKGHAGIPENERADELARLSIEQRS